MVVVIDDRGDVWNWSPNLIKVIPYDFFVGIGDINSSYLPTRQGLIGPSKRRKSVNLLEEQLTIKEIAKTSTVEEGVVQDDVDNENYGNDNSNTKNKLPDGDANAIDTNASDSVITSNNTKAEITETGGDKTTDGEADIEVKKDAPHNVEVDLPEEGYSPVDRMMELTDGGDANPGLLAAQANERTTALEQQEAERPLAKLQENLERIIEEEESNNEELQNTEKINPPRETHNLLNDDDNELEYLGQALFRIHNEFYYRVEQSEKNLPDVKDIMNSMKQLVFREFVFLISGVFPTNVNLESVDLVIWAKSFGATIVSDYDESVTHVICRHPTTFKVRLAKTLNPDVKVVNPDWLFSCMSLWEKVPEDDYLFGVKHLLSKPEIDDYLQSHDIISTRNFETQDIDWGEIHDDLKEFLGSDDEADEDDDSDNDFDNNGEQAENVVGNVSGKSPLKRDRSEMLSDDDTDMMNFSVLEKKQKVGVNEQNNQEEGDGEMENGNEEGDDDDDDDFEKELLEDLAGLEEEFES
ncbi:unnamed protein product [Ambrosiozyma monospora]|uniref:protein-serine/threonine phosphatase n=1 Tax=Ambrosiozyma monospora TaxID=43982 RepID=A0A9W6Z1I7_AMBMO|nr:unnamed protein product [Ambrosiozyma monospora]